MLRENNEEPEELRGTNGTRGPGEVSISDSEEIIRRKRAITTTSLVSLDWGKTGGDGKMRVDDVTRVKSLAILPSWFKLGDTGNVSILLFSPSHHLLLSQLLENFPQSLPDPA